MGRLRGACSDGPGGDTVGRHRSPPTDVHSRVRADPVRRSAREPARCHHAAAHRRDGHPRVAVRGDPAGRRADRRDRRRRHRDPGTPLPRRSAVGHRPRLPAVRGPRRPRRRGRRSANRSVPASGAHGRSGSATACSGRPIARSARGSGSSRRCSSCGWPASLLAEGPVPTPGRDRRRIDRGPDDGHRSSRRRPRSRSVSAAGSIRPGCPTSSSASSRRRPHRSTAPTTGPPVPSPPRPKPARSRSRPRHAA